MTAPSFRSSAIVALFAPLILLVGRAISTPQPDWWPGMPLNWLYMAAPQLVMVLIGAMHAPTHRFAWLSLLSLTLLLFGFQAWVIWWVPPRESGLAWIFYLPVALAVIVVPIVVRFVWNEFHRDVHVSGGG
jgi:hypothetical protein